MSTEESVSAAFDSWLTPRVPRNIVGEIGNRSTTIPPSIRHGLETRLECPLSDLKIIVSPATEIFCKPGADFHTVADVALDHGHSKNTIYFRPGKYNPYSSDGLRILEQGIGQVMASASIGPPTRPRR